MPRWLIISFLSLLVILVVAYVALTAGTTHFVPAEIELIEEGQTIADIQDLLPEEWFNVDRLKERRKQLTGRWGYLTVSPKSWGEWVAYPQQSKWVGGSKVAFIDYIVEGELGLRRYCVVMHFDNSGVLKETRYFYLDWHELLYQKLTGR